MSEAQEIEELKEQYKDEWLAIEVTKEENTTPVEGKLICHSSEREEVWNKTKDMQRVYIFYAGPPLKEGYAAAFSVA